MNISSLILIFYGQSQIFELCHIFKVFVVFVIMILFCFLLMRHEYLPYFGYAVIASDQPTSYHLIQFVFSLCCLYDLFHKLTLSAGKLMCSVQFQSLLMFLNHPNGECVVYSYFYFPSGAPKQVPPFNFPTPLPQLSLNKTDVSAVSLDSVTTPGCLDSVTTPGCTDTPSSSSVLRFEVDMQDSSLEEIHHDVS